MQVDFQQYHNDVKINIAQQAYLSKPHPFAIRETEVTPLRGTDFEFRHVSEVMGSKKELCSTCRSFIFFSTTLLLLRQPILQRALLLSFKSFIINQTQQEE